MSPRLNEEQLIAKLEADLEARRAKILEKEKERRAKIAKRIEAKEEQIRKLDAEILKLNEELGIQAGPIDLKDGDVAIAAASE